MQRSVSLALAMVFASACSGNVTNEEAPAEPICTRTSDSRVLTMQLVGGGQIYPGSGVLSENGFQFLVVDDQCRFWVQTEAFGEVRSGALDEAQEDELSRRLDLGVFSERTGQYVIGANDASTRLVRFRGEEVSLTGSGFFPEDTYAAKLDTASAEALPWVASLGTAANGSVRYQLVQEAGTPAEAPFASAAVWPFPNAASASITQAQATSETPPASKLVTAPADAEALRGLARAYRAGENGSKGYPFLPVVSGESCFSLFVRDTVPFEDETGRWRSE